jgi:glycosyltransferase involved in cell wall biosynthesis
MTPIKNYDLLLEAIRRLVDQGIEVRGLLVGDGPELLRLREHVNRLPQLQDRVHFVGASQAVSEWLTAMDVFVQPSLAEGMSNTLLEAMSAGLPILATATGGNPEVMEDGRHGWLYRTRDVGALTQRLARLAADEMLRRQFGAAARAHAIEQFGLQRMLDNYAALYSKLAGRAA